MRVRVHHEDDTLWAEVPELPGCFASGDDLEELRQSLEEAIRLHLGADVTVNALGEPLDTVEDRELLVSG